MVKFLRKLIVFIFHKIRFQANLQKLFCTLETIFLRVVIPCVRLNLQKSKHRLIIETSKVSQK